MPDLTPKFRTMLATIARHFSTTPPYPAIGLSDFQLSKRNHEQVAVLPLSPDLRSPRVPQATELSMKQFDDDALLVLYLDDETRWFRTQQQLQRILDEFFFGYATRAR